MNNWTRPLYSRQLELARPREAWAWYRSVGLDFTMLQLEGMWWRITRGGDC